MASLNFSCNPAKTKQVRLKRKNFRKIKTNKNMNSLKLLLLIMFFPVMLWAQNIDVAKDGTVTVNGKEAFKIEGKMGMANTSFSVYNQNGDLLISADGRNENNFMTVTFSGNNSSLDYPLTMGLKKVFAKELATLQVIKDGQLNPDGVKRLVAKYNGRADQNLVLTESNTRNTIKLETRPAQVIRNREANIIISGTTIKQDNKEIGKITSKQETKQGTVVDYFVITDTNGNHIANASKAMDSSNIEIISSDNTKRTISVEAIQYNKFELQQLIVKDLVKNSML
jgi:hypothetical protein